MQRLLWQRSVLVKEKTDFSGINRDSSLDIWPDYEYLMKIYTQNRQKQEPGTSLLARSPIALYVKGHEQL